MTTERLSFADDQKRQAEQGAYQAFLSRLLLRDERGQFARACERGCGCAGVKLAGRYEGEWLCDDCAYFADNYETMGGR